MEKADPEVVEKACNQVDSVLNARIPLLMRIKFPLVWARLPDGIRVQDLHEDRYNDALEHLKKVYMADEVLCKSISLTDDPESVENFSKLILSRMQDTQSLIAVKEDENRVIGCLIERVIDSLFMKTMSRMAIYEGSNLCKIQRLRKHILKQINLQEVCGTHRCNDIYAWSVEEQYRNRGIGKAMLRAAIRQSQLFKTCSLCGIFTSDIAQTIARNENFQSVYEVLYSSWVEGQEIVFENPGENNYSANFMTLIFEQNLEITADEDKKGEADEDTDSDKLKQLDGKGAEDVNDATEAAAAVETA